MLKSAQLGDPSPSPPDITRFSIPNPDDLGALWFKYNLSRVVGFLESGKHIWSAVDLMYCNTTEAHTMIIASRSVQQLEKALQTSWIPGEIAQYGLGFLVLNDGINRLLDIASMYSDKGGYVLINGYMFKLGSSHLKDAKLFERRIVVDRDSGGATRRLEYGLKLIGPADKCVIETGLTFTPCGVPTLAVDLDSELALQRTRVRYDLRVSRWEGRSFSQKEFGRLTGFQSAIKFEGLVTFEWALVSEEIDCRPYVKLGDSGVWIMDDSPTPHLLGMAILGRFAFPSVAYVSSIMPIFEAIKMSSGSTPVLFADRTVYEHNYCLKCGLSNSKEMSKLKGKSKEEEEPDPEEESDLDLSSIEMSKSKGKSKDEEESDLDLSSIEMSKSKGKSKDEEEPDPEEESQLDLSNILADLELRDEYPL
jgi:hypothetical protein